MGLLLCYANGYGYTVPVQELCDLACNNSLLDLCYTKQLPGTPMVDAHKVFPMNWRFFPTLDPQVKKKESYLTMHVLHVVTRKSICY